MIKPIDEIPMNQSMARKSYRERIRKDIWEAIHSAVFKFEFVGDYNFKTLAQTAREEAWRVASQIVSEWSKKHPEYHDRYKFWKPGSWEVNNLMKLIMVTSIKGETPDKRRVFCEIQPDMDSIIEEYAEKRCTEYEKRKANGDDSD